MRTATLTRTQHTDEGTFGVLVFGRNTVHSLELPWRENRRQKSCIPVGTYQCAIVNSPRFGRVYGVANVPGRSNILIHSANFAGNVDLGWKTQLQGCIALGMRLGKIGNQRAALVSRPAIRLLNEWSGGMPFTLEIQNG